MTDSDPKHRPGTIRGARVGAHLLLVGAFCIVIVGDGHRALPVALVLVSSSWEKAGPTLLLGWSGIAVLLAAAFVSRPAGFAWTTVTGTVLLLAGWGSLLPTTDLPIFTFMTAVPFLMGAVARMVLLPWKANRG